jgi:ATP-binding cassette subfamily B protein
MVDRRQVLTAKLRNALAQLVYLPRALALVWAAARGRAAVWVALLLVQGLLPLATVYLTKLLVDGLVAAAGAGGTWQSLAPLLLLVALMAGIMLLAEVLRSATSWVRAAQAELVKDHISALILQKSAALLAGGGLYARLWEAQPKETSPHASHG